MNMVEAANKANESAVILYLFDGTGRLDIGTGVLVTVGGKDFVFSAGHNLEDCRDKNDIRLFFPGYDRVLQATHGGGQGIVNYRWAREPDVGFIELCPDDKLLWARRTPVRLDDLTTAKDVRPDEQLVLVGFPAEDTTTAEGLRKDRQDVALSTKGICIGAILDPVHSPHEPLAGRGIHVRLHGEFFDSVTGENVKLPRPEGISGGPLVAVSAGGVRLLGLARSAHGDDERYEWCEPAYEAARMLLEHENDDVREDVRRVLRTLGV